jgi:RNase H-fold protein (predicted Holliday junction resolvase)
MGIVLTEQEKQLVKEGKLDPSSIEEHRRANPVKSVDKGQLDQMKQSIREATEQYKESIAKNKQLYVELQENRKKKEDCRNRLAELRKKKKELLGQ